MSFRLRPLHRLCLSACAALLLAASPPAAVAFNLTDHAKAAMVQPYPKIAEVEAEAVMTPQVAAEEDPAAANGKAAVLALASADAPALRWTVELAQRSTYALWAIARSSDKPGNYREPMYVHLHVTGPEGYRRQWRMRINYMGRVYQDVAHLYFDAPMPGEYELTFALGHDSRFDLLVDRLELRDVLAGTFRKGYKTESVLFPSPAAPKDAPSPYGRDEALRRARQIAASFPPRNSIKTSGGMDRDGFYSELNPFEARFAEPNASRWAWRMNEDIEAPWVFSGPVPEAADEIGMLLEGGAAPGSERDGPVKVDTSVASKSFGVAPSGQAAINWSTARPGPVGTYTAEDYHAFRKSTGRWPDDGGGYFIPRTDFNTPHHLYYNALAGGFKNRIEALRRHCADLAERYYTTGDPRAAFRAAVILIHFADLFPSLDHTVQGTMNTIWGTYPFQNFAGNDNGSYGKIDYSGWAGAKNLGMVLAYDKLFTFIKNNALLAEAVGQDIAWVKSPADVIELLDVKLLQHFFDVADRGQVRFGPGVRCDPIIAVVQGDNEAGRAMLRRIVSVSDFQHASLLDNLVVRHSRDSTTYIGSMYYAKGPSLEAGTSIADVTRFAQAFGRPELALTGPHKTTLLRQAAEWLIEPYAGGVHIPGVGDVSGPQGYPTMTLEGDVFAAQRVLLAAWQAYGNDAFAWMLEHVYGFPPGTPADVVEEARTSAARVAGDPRANQPSRALSGFGVGILEMHGDVRDFRDRTAVVLRAGPGAGHAHNDQLNLEIFSKGIIAAAEFGGRGGYGEPATGAAVSHNLVTVDGAAPPAQLHMVHHARAAASLSAGSDKIYRFVSLIDAGEREAYLFDVTRAHGGKTRTYHFHGNQTEAVDSAVTASSSGAGFDGGGDPLLDDFLTAMDKPVAGQPSEWTWNPRIFSHNLPGKQGKAPAIYQAVWPLQRQFEQSILSRIAQIHPFARGQFPDDLKLSPSDPTKFTRLILFGSQGRQVKHIVATSRQVGYRIEMVGISETRPEDEVSLFPAIIEPFAGESNITGFRPLTIAPAAGAFAAEVSLGKRRDVLAYGGEAAVSRRVNGAAAPLVLEGEFGMVSRDGDGIRSATLVHGAKLESDGITLALPQATYRAPIVQVDHLARQVTVDAAWPEAMLAGTYFRLSSDGGLFNISHATRQGDRTVLHFAKTAETYRSEPILIEGQTIIGRYEPEAPQKVGYITDETGQHGWRLVDARTAGIRWMTTTFRGGAHSGYDLSWDRIPDVNGDGKRTLRIGPGGEWTEPMIVEVLDVDPAQRTFLFRPQNSPAGYSGTRSYAQKPIRNERDEVISTSVMPGKMGAFEVEGELSPGALADADGDGVGEFRVFYFGPGDTASLPCFASLRRLDDGRWEVTANTAPVTVTVGSRSWVLEAGDFENGVAVVE